MGAAAVDAGALRGVRAPLRARRPRDASSATHVGFVVCRCEDDAIVGVFNIGEIVRGLFKSAYLGYYAFAPHAGDGYMTEGLELVLAGRVPRA